MMIDPWDMAAECEYEFRICPDDPDRKALLMGLRDLWLAIGKEKLSGVADWHLQAANAERMHAELFRTLH
jgi:hypothetical protein